MKNKIMFVALTMIVLGAVVLPAQTNALGVKVGTDADVKLKTDKSTTEINSKTNTEVDEDWQENEDLPKGITTAPGIEMRIEKEKGLPYGIFKKFFSGISGNGDNELHIDIDNLKVNVTDESATVTFKTNVETSGELEYSTSSDFSNSTKVDISLSSEHSIKLTGLESDTKYYYQMELKDKDDQVVLESKARAFTTDEEDSDGPKFLFINVFDIESDSAAIIWVTSEKADAKVWVENDSDIDVSGSPVKSVAELSYFHVIELAGLTTSADQYVKIASTDNDGNVSYSGVTSFTTD